jgi:anthranilate/para-aminobenzoate synthase component II
MRYHSLGVRRADLAREIMVSAWLLDDPEQVMGLWHQRHDLQGIQFHPESFMTPQGRRLIRAWLASRTLAASG